MCEEKLFEVVRQGIVPSLFPNEVFAYFSIPEFDEFGMPSLTAGRQIESNKFVVRDGDVLVSKLNPRIKRVWKVVNPGVRRAIASTEFVCLRPTERVSSDYLYFALQDEAVFRLLQAYATGTTNSHQRFQPDEIQRAPIPCCSPPTQRKIARILQTVDRAMEKTEALIEKYQQIKAGLMHDLFTRGLWTQEELDRGDHRGLPTEASAKVGQLRPTRQDAPHLYQQSPIGWIPKAWDWRRVGGLLAGIEQGWSPDCESNPASQLEWGVLKTSAIQWDGFRSSENKRLPSHLFPRTQYRIKVGDLLVTRAGPNSRVGVISLVDTEPGKLLLSDKIYRLQTNEEIDAEYLGIALSSDSTQRFLDGFKTGLAESQTNISQAIIRRLVVALPKESERALVIKVVDGIRSKINSLELEYTKLQKQKSGLMHDLLTGKVPVTPDP